MVYTPKRTISVMAGSVICLRRDSKEFSFRKIVIFWRSAATSCLTRWEQRVSTIRGSINGVVTRPPLERCKLTLVLRLMKFSVTSPNAGAAAQEKYLDFIQDGIGNPSIWEGLKAQSLLGVEGFAEGLPMWSPRSSRCARYRRGNDLQTAHFVEAIRTADFW